jgi:hypothetical protein
MLTKVYNGQYRFTDRASQRCFVFAVFMLQTCCVLAQTSTAAPRATEINEEAGEIFISLRDSITTSTTAEQVGVVSRMKDEIKRRPEAFESLGSIAADPSTILTADPSQLTYQQRSVADKIMIAAHREYTDQIVLDSGTTPAPPTLEGLDTVTKVLNSISPDQTPLSASHFSSLLDKSASIGRLLWTKPKLLASGTPMWQLAGTVFVTSPGIVTTACHTLRGQGDQPLVDIKGNTVTLLSDMVLRVEFGNSPQYQTMYPVSGIVAISGQAGCDVAQLRIDGADNIPALKVAAKNKTATRVVVFGYPLLNNYSSFECAIGQGGNTEKEFCVFHSSNPKVAKVASPGKVLTRDIHEGVSVFTYDAPTDGGQSGSPVFDADTLEVIGIHYCCSGSDANSSVLACANWHPQNVAWNEAIASETLVDDQILKSNFSDIDFSASAANSLSPESVRVQNAQLRAHEF